MIIHLKLHKESPSSPSRKALHVQSRSYWAPANIGPYSQATCIPITSRESHISAVSIAGQIPLVPSTMALPSLSDRLGTFKLQTVLALQHLWRVGQEMQVRWFTSAVAYLPRGATEDVAARAAIAGQAWAQMHKPRTDEEGSEDDEARDLWEEKHYAGMENEGGRRGREERSLPDWSIVESGSGDEGEVQIQTSPFFSVEVEELPRESLVEWHAHLGIANGPVKVRTPKRRWEIPARMVK